MDSRQLAIALNKVSPEKGTWNVKERDNKVWWIWKGEEKDKPTEEQLQAAWDSIGYQYERQYPKIPDQLDALWHDIDDGILGVEAKESKWYKSIKEVKDSNPKEV